MCWIVFFRLCLCVFYLSKPIRAVFMVRMGIQKKYRKDTGELVLPSSLTAIATTAFRDCSGFTGTLSIPDTITQIGVMAFQGCTGFDDIVIPSSVRRINAMAFENVKHITYGGSASGSPWGAKAMN